VTRIDSPRTEIPGSALPWLVLIALVGIALRLANITHEAAWGDEALTTEPGSPSPAYVKGTSRVIPTVASQR
jgi:hypothetical protein